jgi:hypothetical protein
MYGVLVFISAIIILYASQTSSEVGVAALLTTPVSVIAYLFSTQTVGYRCIILPFIRSFPPCSICQKSLYKLVALVQVHDVELQSFSRYYHRSLVHHKHSCFTCCQTMDTAVAILQLIHPLQICGMFLRSEHAYYGSDLSYRFAKREYDCRNLHCILQRYIQCPHCTSMTETFRQRLSVRWS